MGKQVRVIRVQCVENFHCSRYWRQVVFFFQAEDGIRDRDVTGVQTCALPISDDEVPVRQTLDARHPGDIQLRCVLRAEFPRSEERRVGKECRSWWWTYHS